ncbi:MAG: DNA/RNA non-specific endonuclease [Bacteroidia bacterium]
MLFLRIIFPVCLFLSGGLLFSPKQSGCQPGNSDSIRDFAAVFYPETKKTDQIIRHLAYALCYEEKYEQARWVAYRLTSAMVEKSAEERTDDFREDKEVPTGSASPDDYKKSGYDRGHLCPAGDMAWSERSMSESFYMSNMSPQAPKFNRGIWKTLESDVRDWAGRFDELYIVAGGVLKDSLETIGEDKVAVPKYFYKVILDVKGPEKKAIAFVMPNEGSKNSVFDYAVTIDSVERLTDINFFPALPDDLENDLESHINVNLWQNFK